MGLKELIAVAALALTSCQSNSLNNEKPAFTKTDIESAVKEAEMLYARDNPPATVADSDRERAIPLYLRVLESSEASKETIEKCKAHLRDCRISVATGAFNTSQLLINYDNLPAQAKQNLNRVLNIHSLPEAHEQAKFFSRKTSSLIEEVIKEPASHEIWMMYALSSLRFDDYKNSARGYRKIIELKPDGDGYNGLFATYVGQSKPGDFLDEMDNFKGTDIEKREQVARGVREYFQKMRAVRKMPRLNLEKREDALKAGELFYLVSNTLWENELKKQRPFDRDFSEPVQSCFRAGSYELLVAKDDDERLKAYRKMKKVFDSINSGMENALGKFEQSYELIVLKNKSIYIDQGDKVLKWLKDPPKKEF